jgi:hypothetical protein
MDLLRRKELYTPTVHAGSKKQFFGRLLNVMYPFLENAAY